MNPSHDRPQPEQHSASSEPSTVRVNAPTEEVNPRTRDIDLLSTVEVLRAINAEDHSVPVAVSQVLPELAQVVDLAATILRNGGRVHYVGAGTSGRLAVLDAAELPPTFNVPQDWFVAHQAGGDTAHRQAVENAEDDLDAGYHAIAEHGAPSDLVLGLTASGRTPFVLGALQAAQTLGAHTALVTANPATADIRPPSAEVVISPDTGPEPIAGSTRMKAGTAQKLILTSFSTAVMIRLGHTYSNLMVSMAATNAKLRGRTVTILQEATGAPEDSCLQALTSAEGDLKTALVQLLGEVDTEHAARSLRHAQGHVRDALSNLHR